MRMWCRQGQAILFSFNKKQHTESQKCSTQTSVCFVEEILGSPSAKSKRTKFNTNRIMVNVKTHWTLDTCHTRWSIASRNCRGVLQLCYQARACLQTTVKWKKVKVLSRRICFLELCCSPKFSASHRYIHCLWTKNFRVSCQTTGMKVGSFCRREMLGMNLLLYLDIDACLHENMMVVKMLP